MSVYNLANICGAPYAGGRICFTPDDGCIIAPIGNRMTIYDLQTSRSTTLSSQTRSNLISIICHPNKPLAILVDDHGYGYILNLLRDKILHRLQFKACSNIVTEVNKQSSGLNENKQYIGAASFSPDAEYFSISVGSKLLIWRSPQEELSWRMTLHRELTGHMDSINSIDWSTDSKFICTSSNDLTVRLWSVDQISGFTPLAFVDHRRAVKSAFFTMDMDRMFSISKEGVIIIWKISDDNSAENSAKHIGSRNRAVDKLDGEAELNDTGKCRFSAWVKETQGYCNQPKYAIVACVSYNKKTNLFVVGFTGGTFGLYRIPELTSLYTLRIGNELPIIDSVDMTSDGDWLGLACSETGTLVVWEWKSETYIMKQQGHSRGVRSVAFSTSGSSSINVGSAVDKELNVDIDQNYSGNKLGLGSRYVTATGGFDGKVKLWDSTTGLCYVTFEDHTSSVEAICFTPQANAIITASLDGTVRAFDLMRYRNFRTFTAPGAQFISISCDSSGSIIAAGSKGESYSVFIWDLQTGRELDILHGHTAPVSSVVFHPHPAYSGYLVSSSWDKYINIWNIYGRPDKGGTIEPLLNTSSVLAIAFDPRGNSILAASVLCGYVVFWDLDNSEQIGSIDGLRDIQSGRYYDEKYSSTHVKTNDVQTNVNKNQHFNSLTYTSSGALIICGSRNSPYICIYSTESYMLVHIFTLTRNRSFSGIIRELNSKYMTDYGYSIQEYDLSDEESDDIQTRKRIQTHNALPGVQIGELKNKMDRFNVWSVASSPDSRQFAAATSHGLYIYSLDSYIKTPTYTNEAMKSLNRFEPQLLTKNVTRGNVYAALERKEYTEAFILAMALNDIKILLKVYESIPINRIFATVVSIDTDFICILLNFIRNILNVDSPNGTIHLNLHLVWLEAILSIHMHNIMSGYINREGHHLPQCRNLDLRSMMLLLLRQVKQTRANIAGVIASNTHTIEYIRHNCKKQ